MSSALARSNGIGRYAFEPLYWPAQIEAWHRRRTRRRQFEVLPWAVHTTHAAHTQRVRRIPLELAWPDRAALVAAFIIAALCVFAWIVTFLSVETVTYGRLNNALAFWTLVAEMVTAVPFWIFLRVIDFMNGGPETRRKAALRRRIEPLFEADGAGMPAE